MQRPWKAPSPEQSVSPEKLITRRKPAARWLEDGTTWMGLEIARAILKGSFTGATATLKKATVTLQPVRTRQRTRRSPHPKTPRINPTGKG